MSATWWAFHGTTAAPVARDLPVAHLWAVPAHREWAARFATVVADRGFAVLTGDAGVGKSTALRSVWETRSPNQYLLRYLPASDDGTPRQFYRRLAHLLGPRRPAFPRTEQQVRDTLWATTRDKAHGRIETRSLTTVPLREPLHAPRGLLPFAQQAWRPDRAGDGLRPHELARRPSPGGHAAPAHPRPLDHRESGALGAGRHVGQRPEPGPHR